MTDETSQQRKLLESLYLRTLDRKITWRYDSTEDSCESSVGQGYVQISQEVDEDGDLFPVVKLLNGKKEVIDRITGGFGLYAEKPFNTPHKDYWDLIRELKIKAERAAKGADIVIQSILHELGAERLDLGDDIPF